MHRWNNNQWILRGQGRVSVVPQPKDGDPENHFTHPWNFFLVFMERQANWRILPFTRSGDLFRTCHELWKILNMSTIHYHISIVPVSIYSTSVSLRSATSISLGQSAPNSLPTTVGLLCKEPLLKLLVFLACELNGYQRYKACDDVC